MRPVPVQVWQGCAVPSACLFVCLLALGAKPVLSVTEIRRRKELGKLTNPSGTAASGPRKDKPAPPGSCPAGIRPASRAPFSMKSVRVLCAHTLARTRPREQRRVDGEQPVA